MSDWRGLGGIKSTESHSEKLVHSTSDGNGSEELIWEHPNASL
jgi:hypothetical protein